MKSLQSVLIAIPLASVLMFAQQATPDAAPAQADKPQVEKTSQAPAAAEPAVSSSQAARTTGQADASNSRTYTGTIVSANCAQASALTGSNYASYADRSAAAPPASPSGASSAGNDSSAATKSSINKNPKSVYDLQHDVLKNCPASTKVDSFAIVTDDGKFLKLDDAGNTQVKNSAGKSMKNMKVTIAGALEGDTLKVQSFNKL